MSLSKRIKREQQLRKAELENQVARDVARKAQEERDAKLREDKGKAIREELAQIYIDPVINEINKNIASGKGEIYREHNSTSGDESGSFTVSLHWNAREHEEGSGNTYHIRIEKFESISISVYTNGTVIFRSPGASMDHWKDWKDEYINVLKDQDAKRKVEDAVVELFRQGKQEYRLEIDLKRRD